jgi:ribosomal protein L30/L7E
MLCAIRLRGSIKVRKDIKDTMDILGLKKVNTLVVLDDIPIVTGMIKKVENFVTWGNISDETMKNIGNQKIVRLKCPKGGLKSVKMRYPKGDLGYRGDSMNKLIERMR